MAGCSNDDQGFQVSGAWIAAQRYSDRLDADHGLTDEQTVDMVSRLDGMEHDILTAPCCSFSDAVAKLECAAQLGRGERSDEADFAAVRQVAAYIRMNMQQHEMGKR